MKIFLAKSYKKIKEFTLRNIEIKPESRILDIGCGSRGNFWGFAAESYTGLDADKNVLEKLQRRTDGIYKLHDVCKGLPYGEGVFDYIVSVSFFHHLSDKQAEQLSSQIKRVLSRNGRAIIIDGVYPDSKINLLGWLIRYFDRGRFIRNGRGFEQLFLKEFQIEANYSFTENIFAYTVLRLRPKNE